MDSVLRLARLALIACTLVALPAAAGEVLLDWQPSPGASGYRVYQGTASGQYDTIIEAGALSDWRVEGLADCTTYWFATTASNIAGESGFSNEVSSWARAAIAAIVPAAAGQGLQLPVVLTGTNFHPGSTVSFSNPDVQVVSIESISCNEIRATLSVGSQALTGPVEVTVAHPNGVAGSAAGLLTIDATQEPDFDPPTIISASAVLFTQEVAVVYSEPVNPASATSVANYSLDNGVSILSASASADLRTVTLACAGLQDGVSYVLTVNNVTDLAAPPNTIAPDTQVTITSVASAVLEERIDVGNNDAEEDDIGEVFLNSGDLELGSNAGRLMTVGLRFPGLGIPRGALITRAYVQFMVDELSPGTANLLVESQAADDAGGFGLISTRPRNPNGVAWSPPPWDAVGASEQTPDIAGLIQQVVNRPGWAEGNALVLIITGTGNRTAESFEGDPAGAPLLHVEYTIPAIEPPLAPAGLQVF